jgi:tetratricopeptide (TPR) repeat protein
MLRRCNSHILRLRAVCLLAVFVAVLSVPVRASAQSDYEKEKARAIELCDQNKFAEAQPILEKLTSSNPNDIVVIEKLAVVLVASAANQSGDTRTKTLLRARSLALRARELGDDSNLIKVLLERLPHDGKVVETGFSEHKDADDAMKAAEKAYAKGDFGAAIAGYQRAIATDPKLYEAPLFMGDVYFQMKQLDKAGEAYSKAIAIEPNRETAYRYWADVLTKSGRLADARLKLIEALIAEPYNTAVYRGVGQWAEVAGVVPAHPNIEVPEFKREQKDGKATVDIAVAANETDGSTAWMFYSLTRMTWLDGKRFAKAYPNEKDYRHTLAEESEALRGVIEAVANQQKDNKIKSLDPRLATLVKLSQAGLLEAFVLLARSDQDIALDYERYRALHRDKIRQYLSDYVMPAAKK